MSATQQKTRVSLFMPSVNGPWIPLSELSYALAISSGLSAMDCLSTIPLWWSGQVLSRCRWLVSGTTKASGQQSSLLSVRFSDLPNAASTVRWSMN